MELFQQGIKEFELRNISKIIELPRAITTTDDLIEHRGLDPWVQWVSVHTGMTLSEHGVMRLGDASFKLQHPQLWERLSDMGVTTGIWGAMNATRGNSPTCKFFLPDPWTFGESAYPDQLNDLLALPRYYSKNYLNVSKRSFLALSLRILKFVLGSGALINIAKQIPFMVKGLLRNGLNNAILFILFDLISTTLFLVQKKKSKPQFSLIFLNSIAHIQHHSWHITNPMSADLKFALQSIDRIAGSLLGSLSENEALIVMNGLTQRNVTAEPLKIMYRQIDPAGFMKSAGLAFERVEQLMTFDGHVFFHTQADRDLAATVLQVVRIEGKPLFQVVPDEKNPLQLFYQVDFWEPLEADVTILINGKHLQFFNEFQAVVARTGSHIPEGTILSDKIEFNEQLYNHEVFPKILYYFSC